MPWKQNVAEEKSKRNPKNAKHLSIEEKKEQSKPKVLLVHA